MGVLLLLVGTCYHTERFSVFFFESSLKLCWMIQETLVKCKLASRSPGGFSLLFGACHAPSNAGQFKICNIAGEM